MFEKTSVQRTMKKLVISGTLVPLTLSNLQFDSGYNKTLGDLENDGLFRINYYFNKIYTE